MNAKNITTGTVHNATERDGHLVQTCGIRGTQTASLVATTDAVTCGKCSKAPARKATAAPAPRATSAGPTIWGVFSTAGNLATFRNTKKDAAAVAAKIGGTIRKI